MGLTKQEAYDDMNTTFTSQRRNATFEMYVNKHTSAHQTLEEYGEPQPESKKVDAFLKGILDKSPSMSAGLANVPPVAALPALNVAL